MSTLVAQTISNGTVSTSSANVIQGSAKAWVNFNGTGTVAIRASYNVSSITDNGTGNYTINFTNALSDANYSCVGNCNFSTGISWMTSPFNAGTKTSTALQIGTVSNNAYTDLSEISVSVFR